MEYSSGYMINDNTAALASVSQFASAWLSVMAAESGSSRNPGEGRPSPLPSRDTREGSLPRRLTLLLAEDNLPDVLLVREIVREENLPLDVHVAADGQAAIAFIESAEADANAPAPDFVLLDLNLPKRDGFEVLRRLRLSAKFQDTPVLIMTSSDAPADVRMAASLGAGYFHKPASYDEFMKLGDVMRERLKGAGLI